MNLHGSLALLVVLGVLPGVSRAESGPGRDGIPYAAVRVSVLSGLPDLIGVSASAYPWRTAAVEAGVGTLGLALNAYARVGVAMPAINGRKDEASGFSVFLTPMVGYRYLESVPFDTVSRFHGVNGVLALDGAYWIARHFGLGLQLAGGATLWLARDNPDAPPVVPDLRLTVGVLF